MNKLLINNLEKATTRAAQLVIQSGYPISISKNLTIVGNLFIEKSINKSYKVLLSDKSILFDNISVFDVAIILAQQYKRGHISAVKQIIYLEGKYLKYHNDMIYYLHCMKGAKKTHDNERFFILEDKFYMAEILAKNIKDKIIFFKKIK